MHYLKSLLLCLFVVLSSFANAQDTSAQNIVKRNLDLIESYLNARIPKPAFSYWASVDFLVFLTGIPSSTGGDYGGRYAPDATELAYWKSWFEKNKLNISWDQERKVIILHKEVTPPKN